MRCPALRLCFGARIFSTRTLNTWRSFGIKGVHVEDVLQTIIDIVPLEGAMIHVKSEMDLKLVGLAIVDPGLGQALEGRHIQSAPPPVSWGSVRRDSNVNCESPFGHS